MSVPENRSNFSNFYSIFLQVKFALPNLDAAPKIHQNEYKQA